MLVRERSGRSTAIYSHYQTVITVSENTKEFTELVRAVERDLLTAMTETLEAKHKAMITEVSLSDRVGDKREDWAMKRKAINTAVASIASSCPIKIRSMSISSGVSEARSLALCHKAREQN